MTLPSEVKAALRELYARCDVSNNGTVDPISFEDFAAEIERLVLEARGNTISECSRWIKYNANSDKYLKNYITHDHLHVDSNKLSWDLKQALTHPKQQEQENERKTDH